MKRWWSVPVRWLLGGALLIAACDLVENRKFEPEPGTVVGPAPIPGSMGGFTGTVFPPGIGGAGGFGGIGGGSGMRCPSIQTDYCVATCYAPSPASQSPMCDPSGTWVCAAGWSFSQSCPVGSCGNSNSGFCCMPQTGLLSKPPCNSNGYYDSCPTGSYSTGVPMCILMPDAGTRIDAGSTCKQLNGQACATPGSRCTETGTTCFCQPPTGGGSPTWLCASTAPTPSPTP